MARRGFTLMEVMVVAIIIAIMLAAAVPAYLAARRAGRRAMMITEVQQIGVALEAFKAKFGDYPPDFANTNRPQALKEVQRFILKAWPRIQYWPSDFDPARASTLANYYTPGMALPFWLEGVRQSVATDPDGIGEGIGFSADPTNPFDLDTTGATPGEQVGDTQVSAGRVPRFMPFAHNRLRHTTLTAGPSPVVTSINRRFPCYWPAFPGDDTMLADTTYRTRQVAGYVYFKSNNGYDNRLLYTNSARSRYVGAMKDTSSLWIAKESFQIRCCGLDGLWWAAQDVITGGQVQGNGYWGDALNSRSQTIGGTTFKTNPENADDLSTAWDGELSNNW